MKTCPVPWPLPFFVAPVHVVQRDFPNILNQQKSKVLTTIPSLEKPVELDAISLPILLFTWPSKNDLKKKDKINNLSDASAAKMRFLEPNPQHLPILPSPLKFCW